MTQEFDLPSRRSLEQRVHASLSVILGHAAAKSIECSATEDGRATLAGSVASRDEVALCTAATQTVPGVQSIDNKLSITTDSRS